MACNPIERVTSGCKDADQPIVDEIMETTDAENRGMDRIEFVRAKTIGLPDDMQKFGFDQLMVITTAQWFDESRADDIFPGAEVPTTFAVNSNNDDVAPIDEFAEESFTLINPAQADPKWDDWVDSITYSDPFNSVRDCAESH